MTRAIDGVPIALTDHMVTGAPYVPDNMHGPLEPTGILVHFTVSGSGPATARSLAHESVGASVHVVLERDGSLIQQVPFNRIAWHAGESEWRGRPRCSTYMIGIEVVNWGPLFPDGAGGWQNIYEQPVDVAHEPYHGPHQGPPGCPWAHWERYTVEQLLTLAELCRVLVDAYPTITEIVGHDDVAPGRKRDPGPAMDLAQLRVAVFGPGES